jgi:hypothetical protein
MRAVLDAAVQGWGIAFVLEQFAQQELESGVLQHVLTPYWGLDDAFHLYYPHRERMPGKVRAFVEFMRTSPGKTMHVMCDPHPVTNRQWGCSTTRQSPIPALISAVLHSMGRQQRVRGG